MYDLIKYYLLVGLVSDAIYPHKDIKPQDIW